MIYRRANQEDYNEIFLMGYDVWSDGLIEDEYLKNCNESEKYSQGEWWILQVAGVIVSSLIVYELKQHWMGIGSLATTLNARNNGCATSLLTSVVKALTAAAAGQPIFLYSDINPNFYKKIGFNQIPAKFQRYRSSVGMYFVSGDKNLVFQDTFEAPTYF